MIDEFNYQMLLDISDDLGITRQAVHQWKKLNKVPLVHALKADSVTQGKLNAYQLTGGYVPTHAQYKLMLSAVETIVNGEHCTSTAHILNYLQIAQPPLYDCLVENITATKEGRKYLDNRMMHTGESGEAQHDS